MAICVIYTRQTYIIIRRYLSITHLFIFLNRHKLLTLLKSYSHISFCIQYTNYILLCYLAITIIHQYFIPFPLWNKSCLWCHRSPTNTHTKTLLEYILYCIVIVHASLNYQYFKTNTISVFFNHALVYIKY